MPLTVVRCEVILTIVNDLRGGIIMKKFSPERLLFRRKQRKKTQQRLSKEIGVSQASISAIEKGRKVPKVSTLAGFSEALECEIDYFFITG